jgi:MoaA/NifB/PqqE/SkfB family radical SAM enzyme
MNTIQPENWKPYYKSFGPMKPDDCMICRWYHLELDSHCNLRCALCFPGNMEGYESTHGRMSLNLVERIYDKIITENPRAVVRPYGNSEPFLYPWLPEAIEAANRRGLLFELSSNLNYVQRLEETLAAKPSYLLVGISGWTQETYSRSHHGGDIEKVKANLIRLAALRAKYPIRTLLNYHIYIDNRGEEMEEAKKFASDYGYEGAVPRPCNFNRKHAVLSQVERKDEHWKCAYPGHMFQGV